MYYLSSIFDPHLIIWDAVENKCGVILRNEDGDKFSFYIAKE